MRCLSLIIWFQVGITIHHYKDPYQPTSIMECHKGFERFWSLLTCHKFQWYSKGAIWLYVALNRYIRHWLLYSHLENAIRFSILGLDMITGSPTLWISKKKHTPKKCFLMKRFSFFLKGVGVVSVVTVKREPEHRIDWIETISLICSFRG